MKYQQYIENKYKIQKKVKVFFQEKQGKSILSMK